VRVQQPPRGERSGSKAHSAAPVAPTKRSKCGKRSVLTRYSPQRQVKCGEYKPANALRAIAYNKQPVIVCVG